LISGYGDVLIRTSTGTTGSPIIYSKSIATAYVKKKNNFQKLHIDILDKRQMMQVFQNNHWLSKIDIGWWDSKKAEQLVVSVEE